MDQVYGVGKVGRPWWGNHEGEPLTLEEKRKPAWYGHFRFGLHRQLPNKPKYITIIRDPADRILSEFYRRRLQGNNQTLEDVVKGPWGNNQMVRYLSGARAEEQLTLYHVPRAVKNVEEHFVYVGQTERYSELLDFLRDELGWNVPQQVDRLNATASYAPTHEECAYLLRCPELSLDFQLHYTLVSQGFTARCLNQ